VTLTLRLRILANLSRIHSKALAELERQGTRDKVYAGQSGSRDPVEHGGGSSERPSHGQVLFGATDADLSAHHRWRLVLQVFSASFVKFLSRLILCAVILSVVDKITLSP